MATYRNLRYCEILHDSNYYDVMIGVNNLDEVNDVLQEWALAKTEIGEALDLPEALIKNIDAKEINLSTKLLDNFVYVKSAVSAYMDMPGFAGVSGIFPALPKILDTGLYVMPEITAFLYSTSTFFGIFGEYTIPASSFVLVENAVNYIGVDYNLGSPAYTLYTDQASFNYSSIIPVCAVLSFDTELNVIPFGQAGSGLPEKLLEIQKKRKEFDITTDFTLANSGLYVELSALTVSNGTAAIDCFIMDTETADNDMWLWYRDGSSLWQKTENSTINNTQYQGAGLQSLDAGKFVINYIYRVIDDTNLLIFNILSGSFDTLAAAKESESITDLPDAIKESAVLVGRIIVEKDSASPAVQKVQKVSWGVV